MIVSVIVCTHAWGCPWRPEGIRSSGLTGFGKVVDQGAAKLSLQSPFVFFF